MALRSLGNGSKGTNKLARADVNAATRHWIEWRLRRSNRGMASLSRLCHLSGLAFRPQRRPPQRRRRAQLLGPSAPTQYPSIWETLLELLRLLLQSWNVGHGARGFPGCSRGARSLLRWLRSVLGLSAPSVTLLVLGLRLGGPCGILGCPVLSSVALSLLLFAVCCAWVPGLNLRLVLPFCPLCPCLSALSGAHWHRSPAAASAQDVPALRETLPGSPRSWARTSGVLMAKVFAGRINNGALSLGRSAVAGRLARS